MIRKTTQRQLIIEVLRKAEHPLSVHEILAKVHFKNAGVGIATVYRTLKSLLDKKDIVTVEIPGAVLRYERSDKHHHHHFQCSTCESVFDLHGCLPGLTKLLPKGFQMESHEILIYGRCANCS